MKTKETTTITTGARSALVGRGRRRRLWLLFPMFLLISAFWISAVVVYVNMAFYASVGTRLRLSSTPERVSTEFMRTVEQSSLRSHRDYRQGTAGTSLADISQHTNSKDAESTVLSLGLSAGCASAAEFRLEI